MEKWKKPSILKILEKPILSSIAAPETIAAKPMIWIISVRVERKEGHKMSADSLWNAGRAVSALANGRVSVRLMLSRSDSN